MFLEIAKWKKCLFSHGAKGTKIPSLLPTFPTPSPPWGGASSQFLFSGAIVEVTCATGLTSEYGQRKLYRKTRGRDMLLNFKILIPQIQGTLIPLFLIESFMFSFSPYLCQGNYKTFHTWTHSFTNDFLGRMAILPCVFSLELTKKIIP